MGVHLSRSIAVIFNQRLDYFGQNVNIAAGTQQLADGNEILLTREVSDEVGSQTSSPTITWKQCRPTWEVWPKTYRSSGDESADSVRLEPRSHLLPDDRDPVFGTP